MTRKLLLTAGVCLAGMALAAPAGAQRATGPTALYWMDAETTAGLGGMMGGAGGGRGPGMGAMMGAMMGGGGGFNPNQANKTLLLELGSQRKPTGGAAEADHLPPSTLGAGRALPLTFKANPSSNDPTHFERPKGRLLIYWGCGERAGANQPAVIDFAKLGRGAPLPQIGTVNIGRDRSPSAGGWATYGNWPNERARTTVPPTGRLAGAHTVSSNYAPEISFTLTANQDFMAPLQLKADGKTAAGGAMLTWRPVPRATGYGAVVMGAQGRGEDTVVIWSSSKSQLAGMTLMDYISPAEARRLIGQGVVMPPETTSCAVPVEVTRAVGEGGLVQMIAYGDEANFSYPPRPSDPKQPWKLEWSTKVRYKSTAMQMLGMDMAEMMGGADSYEDEDRPRGPQRGQQQPNRGRDIMRGLGGIGGLIRP